MAVAVVAAGWIEDRIAVSTLTKELKGGGQKNHQVKCSEKNKVNECNCSVVLTFLCPFLKISIQF